MSSRAQLPGATPLTHSLAARIVERVREQGHAAGYRLKELELCGAFGVSRSPIRKALQLLEAQGLVMASPHRGYQVAKRMCGAQPPSMKGVARDGDDPYLRIAEDRIKGRLPVSVTESDLMVRYEMTRQQVQRVLNQMAREHMVDRKPGRGWLFRELLTDSASHDQSYRFRMVIEPAAVLEPGYALDREEIQNCRREQEALLQGGLARVTAGQLYKTGVHLHETIVAGAHNRFLLDSLRTVNQLRRVVEYFSAIDRARLQRQCEEHLQLIDLLTRGERMEASHFLREHLNQARASKTGVR